MSNQLEKIKELIEQHVSAVVKKRLPNSTKKENIQPANVLQCY